MPTFCDIDYRETAVSYQCRVISLSGEVYLDNLKFFIILTLAVEYGIFSIERTKYPQERI